MTIPPVSGGSSDVNNIEEPEPSGDGDDFETPSSDSSNADLPATEEEKKEAILHQMALTIINDWRKFDENSKKRMKQAQQEQ